MMKNRRIRVLLTSNIALPAVAKELGLPPTPFGGWLSLMLEQLAKQGDFSVGVAMRAEVSQFSRTDKNGISYFALPQRRRDRFDVAQADVELVLSEFAPDILHVEGAEMRHSRRFLATWEGVRLLSMQGVLNGIAPYQLGRLPILRMLNPRHPRVALAAITIMLNRRLRFAPRLAHEQAAMTMATDIMGRTLWDAAQAAVLAPEARYHSCARIMRDCFYEAKWNGLNTCKRHTIFVGNGATPLKGAHFALEALAFLRQTFPDVRLTIAGENPLTLPYRSLKRHIGYPVYLRHLIKHLELEDHVNFTGILGAEAMAKNMADSHVYLMSSLIENSPNTLGEAMLLGVPTVSAYAGGAPSMALDGQEALFYRADDPAMLAHQICRIFSNDRLAERLSNAARKRALVTHNSESNLKALVNAYQSIIKTE